MSTQNYSRCTERSSSGTAAIGPYSSRFFCSLRTLVSVSPNLLYFFNSTTTGLGLSIWELWSLAQWQPNIPLMQTIIAFRIKYFYVITLALNLTCTCKYLCTIPSLCPLDLMEIPFFKSYDCMEDMVRA